MMIERDFLRLRALILPRLEGATDAWACEVRALLQGPPASDLFPSTLGWSEPVPRELWPRVTLPCGEPHHSNPERF